MYSLKRSRSKRRVKGGRRTEAEKVNAKCFGEQDPVHGDIMPEYAIRIKEDGHFFCFDIRTLFDWFRTGKRTNPFTNLHFSQSNINKIDKKFIKVGLSTVRMSLRDRIIAHLIQYYDMNRDESEESADSVLWSYRASALVQAYDTRPYEDTSIVDRLGQLAYDEFVWSNLVDRD